jgi:transcriptional regulator with GAF, ATPase, and Fis domain
MQAIYQMIKTVAVTTSTVLITGESGTGKELVARAIRSTSIAPPLRLCRSTAIAFTERCWNRSCLAT